MTMMTMITQVAATALCFFFLSASAFTTTNSMTLHRSTRLAATEIDTSPSTPNPASGSSETGQDVIISAIRHEANYKAGAAQTEFADRYRHLVGAKLKTVGEAFAEFTAELGYTVNPLYKNMVTDLVGTTHLVIVNARFQRDPVWSLGMTTTLDLLLKNYPEKDIAQAIINALYKSMDMDRAQIEAEGQQVLDWVSGKSMQDVENALQGNGDGPLVAIAQTITKEKYWMYSRYFGIGLLKVMESVGVEMDKDEVYPVMERWMKTYLGRPFLSACNDSDLYFKVKERLDMMETMMKEIEIREKKRMAERLEAKAEAAIKAAEKEDQMQEEIKADAAKNRERVGSN